MCEKSLACLIGLVKLFDLLDFENDFRADFFVKIYEKCTARAMTEMSIIPNLTLHIRTKTQPYRFVHVILTEKNDAIKF